MDALIVDYRMGNLRSVDNAFRALGVDAVVSDDPALLVEAPRIVLPGVGAFADGMRHLQEGGWIEPLEREVLERGKPFLGLCVGMQLLATRGTEHGEHPGLGWIAGSVERLPADDVRVPHIGWNDVEPAEEALLYSGLDWPSVFYFVHSYAFLPADEAMISGRCTYGTRFAASVESGNIHATQYHPEKSQRAGLAVLRNFVERC